MTAAASAQVPHDVMIRVTLPADGPYVDVEWEVSRKTPDPWPESGWLCFPVEDPVPDVPPWTPGFGHRPGQGYLSRGELRGLLHQHGRERRGFRRYGRGALPDRFAR